MYIVKYSKTKINHMLILLKLTIILHGKIKRDIEIIINIECIYLKKNFHKWIIVVRNKSLNS